MLSPLRLALPALLLAAHASHAASAPPRKLRPEEAHVERAMAAIDVNLQQKTTSYATLSLDALGRLSQEKDAAWRAAPEGSLARAQATEDAAQVAADAGWASFAQGDLASGKAWFEKRRALRAQAYATRRAMIQAQLQDADERCKYLLARREAAYSTLRQKHPALLATLAKAAREREIPLRPLASKSAIALQFAIYNLREGEVAAWEKAVASNNVAARNRSFERAIALQGVADAVGDGNALRAVRWSLSAQRHVLADAFGRASDSLRFDESDLAAHRAELQRAKSAGEAEDVALAKQGDIAHAMDNIARSHALGGQAALAVREQEEAIALRRSLPRWHPSSSLAEPFLAVGKLYMDLGQVKPARRFHLMCLAEVEREKALRAALPPDSERSIAQSSEVELSEVAALTNLATIAHEGGDSQEALALIERAEQCASQIGARDSNAALNPSLEATVANNRASILVDVGKTEEALSILNSVVAQRRASGLDASAARALTNIASFYRSTGQINKARQSMEQALVLFENEGDLRGRVGTLNSLCSLAASQERWDEAEKLCAQAMQAALALGDIGWQASVQRNQARILMARNKPAEALQVLAATRALDEKVGAPLSTATTLELEGNALMMQVPLGSAPGNATRAAAIKKYEAAVDATERIRANSGSDVFLEQKNLLVVYESLVRQLLRAGRNEDAFDTLSRARSKALVDSLRLDAIETGDAALQGLLQRVQDAEDRLRTAQGALQAEQSRPEAERDEARAAALRGLVARTQAEFDALSGQLRARNPSFDKVIAVKPTLLRSAQKEIPPDTALVQYAPLGNELYTFVVTRESTKVFASEATPAQLYAKVREFRVLMDREREKLQNGDSLEVEDWSQASVAPLRANLKALHAILIAPIEAEVAKKGTVAFIPTQSLFYLPMQALAHDTPAGLRFLIEEKRVAYLASADVMNVVRARSKSLGAGVVALGNPQGADLPFAGEEAQSVARIFSEARQSAQLISGRAATKEALLSPANRSRRVWHLATHGVLNQESPTNSYIQLAPQAQKMDAQKSAAGDAASRLTIKEVWGLDLKKLDLVTLSACQTALGQRDPDGFEITSLANSFAGAGAKSVMASLWSVADDSTSTLMSHFYRSMASGNDKARALQDAELALMRSPKTRHPFFWAPFVLLGDWR